MLHFEPFMCRVMKESQMQTTDNSKWSYKVNLAKYPTEPNDLHINMKDSILTLSGKSEVTCEDGFKVFSTHIWSKEIEVPKRLKKDTLNAKLDDKNLLTLTGEMEDASTEININLDQPVGDVPDLE